MRIKGLLFSQMEPPEGWDSEFHEWYEQEHIPARMVVPGFASAVRYEAVEVTPRYLACYFLDDMAALDTPQYQRLKTEPSEQTARMLGAAQGFTRYICEEIADTGEVQARAGALLVVAMAVPEDAGTDFDAWYDQEHVPLLMQAPGWLRVRRYRVRPGFDGPVWTHLALHEIADISAMSSPEREVARSTEWRARLAQNPWFAASGRWLYVPIHHAVARDL